MQRATLKSHHLGSQWLTLACSVFEVTIEGLVWQASNNIGGRLESRLSHLSLAMGKETIAAR